jgi:pseudouridine-5'-monophosphatase
MSQCLVFEDAENGIRAAVAAEMKVVFVPSLPLSNYDPAVVNQATITLDSLLKFDPVTFGLPPFDDA